MQFGFEILSIFYSDLGLHALQLNIPGDLSFSCQISFSFSPVYCILREQYQAMLKLRCCLFQIAILGHFTLKNVHASISEACHLNPNIGSFGRRDAGDNDLVSRSFSRTVTQNLRL